MTIDRSKHDHGVHDVVDRHADAVARGVRDHTPINHSDLAQVHLAELIPQRRDQSLDGDVVRATQYQRGEGGQGLYGEVYGWDGEELARRFSKP